jgi:hypothetical protein
MRLTKASVLVFSRLDGTGKRQASLELYSSFKVFSSSLRIVANIHFSDRRDASRPRSKTKEALFIE